MSHQDCCNGCCRPTRRNVLKGVGAAAVLSALGVSATGCATKTSVPTELTKAATVDQVPLGKGISVMLEDTPVLISQPEQGTFVAYSSKCPHQGCVVGVDQQNYLCPCHNSGFDFAEGQPQFGPAREPLTRLTCEIQGNDIMVGP